MSKASKIAAQRRAKEVYPQLDDIFDRKGIDRHIGKSTLKVATHDRLPLYVYCYTQRCERMRTWDQVTVTCRGLVRDNKGRVISRGFQKFFGQGQKTTSALRATRMTDDWYAAEKLDGTMVTAGNLDGQLVLATKASFDDIRLTAAARLWPQGLIPEPGTTWVCELVGPDHQIVVEYPQEKLALLSVIDNWTGADRISDIADIARRGGFYLPKRYEAETIDELLAQERDDASMEGFVLVWPRRDKPSGRLKVKYPSWIQAHRARFHIPN